MSNMEIVSYNDEGRPVYPRLHDWFFTGILLAEDKSAELRFRSPNNARVNLHLRGIDMLRVDNFWEGNIVFDHGIAVTDNFIAIIGKELLEGRSSGTNLVGEIEKIKTSIAAGEFKLFYSTTSYGANVYALCKEIMFDGDRTPTT